jgi:DNA-binding protein HU-beta
MTQTELVAAIAAKTMQSRDLTEVFLQAFSDVIASQMIALDEVTVSRTFGKFLPIQRPAGTGRNPSTGEVIQIAAKNGVRFRPSKALVAQLNG